LLVFRFQCFDATVYTVNKVVHSGTNYPQTGAALRRGMLGVLQQPGPQFWGPAVGGRGKIFLCCI